MKRLLILLCALSWPLLAQDPAPVTPNPPPVKGTFKDDKTIEFPIAGKKLSITEFKFKQPLFGKWEISFKVINGTEHPFDEIILNFAFFDKNGQLLGDKIDNDQVRVAAYRLTGLEESPDPVQRTVYIPKELSPKGANRVSVFIASYKMLDNEAEKAAKAEIQRKADEEQAKIDAVKQAQWEKELEEDRRKNEIREALEEAQAAKAAAKAEKEAAKKAIAAKKAAADAKAKREQTIASYSADDQYAIRKHKIRIGMSKEQVTLSWGRPSDINRTTTALGTHEQWVYGMSSYVYFEGDYVTAIQN